MEVLTAYLRNRTCVSALADSDQLLVLPLHTIVICHESSSSCHCSGCSRKQCHGPLPCPLQVSELLTRGVQQSPPRKVDLPNSGNNWLSQRGFCETTGSPEVWGKDESFSKEGPAVFPSSFVTIWEREFGVSWCFCAPRWMFWVSVSTDMACQELLPKGKKKQRS